MTFEERILKVLEEPYKADPKELDYAISALQRVAFKRVSEDVRPDGAFFNQHLAERIRAMTYATLAQNLILVRRDLKR